MSNHAQAKGGRKGGKARTRRKIQAARANVAKARRVLAEIIKRGKGVSR